jgi:hypothetical protein
MMNFGEKILQKEAFLTDKKSRFFMSTTWHFMSTNSTHPECKLSRSNNRVDRGRATELSSVRRPYCTCIPRHLDPTQSGDRMRPPRTR